MNLSSIAYKVIGNSDKSNKHIFELYMFISLYRLFGSLSCCCCCFAEIENLSSVEQWIPNVSPYTVHYIRSIRCCPITWLFIWFNCGGWSIFHLLYSSYFFSLSLCLLLSRKPFLFIAATFYTFDISSTSSLFWSSSPSTLSWPSHFCFLFRLCLCVAYARVRVCVCEWVGGWSV